MKFFILQPLAFRLASSVRQAALLLHPSTDGLLNPFLGVLFLEKSWSEKLVRKQFLRRIYIYTDILVEEVSVTFIRTLLWISLTQYPVLLAKSHVIQVHLTNKTVFGIHKKYLPRESAARAMGLMLEWQMSLVRIGEIGVISMSQRGKFVPENGLQKTWLQNKLLLISINFTPKTSHSFRELWYTMFCRMLKIQPGLRHKNSNTTYSRCFPLTNFSVQSFKHWIRLIVTHFEALPCLG